MSCPLVALWGLSWISLRSRRSRGKQRPGSAVSSWKKIIKLLFSLENVPLLKIVLLHKISPFSLVYSINTFPQGNTFPTWKIIFILVSRLLWWEVVFWCCYCDINFSFQELFFFSIFVVVTFFLAACISWYVLAFNINKTYIRTLAKYAEKMFIHWNICQS